LQATLKYILQRIKIYHPLHAAYRKFLDEQAKRKYRKAYGSFRGAGFECNVCGALYSRFVPWYPSKENEAALTENKVVAGYGENIICPECLSTARERLLIALLKDRYPVYEKKILHFAPEKNLYNFLKDKTTVTTCDIDPGMYRSVDPAVQYQDITKLSFKDQSYDCVIGNHILEHIPDDHLAMKEIFRVLVPGGMAILQVPYSISNAVTIETPELKNPSRQSALYGQNDHVRIYTLDDYMKRLEHAGFEVNIINSEMLAGYRKFATQKEECFLEIKKPG
jgi:SAM-dependent methyltransferase